MGTMSWSDDTRCLFCDGKLPLYRKLAQGQFCSKAHQEAYWKEQEYLAVETLHRTHDALQAYKPSVSIESILGPAPVAQPIPVPLFVDTDPPMAGLVEQTSRLGSVPSFVPRMVAAEPGECEGTSIVVVPEWASEPLSIEAQAVPELDCSDLTTGLLALAEPGAQDQSTTSGTSAEPPLEAVVPSLPVLPSSAASHELEAAGLVEWDALTPALVGQSQPVAEPLEFIVSSANIPERSVAPCDDTLEQIESEVFRLSEQQLAIGAPRPSHRAMRMVQSEAELAELDGAEVAWPVSVPTSAMFEPAFAAELAAIGQPVAVEPLRSAVHGALSPLDAAPVGIEFGNPRLPLATSDPGMAGLLGIGAPAVRDFDGAVVVDVAAVDPPLAAPRIPLVQVAARSLNIRTSADQTFQLNLGDRIQASEGSLRPRAALVPAPVERDPQLPRLKLSVVDPNSPFHGERRRIPGPQLLTAAVNFWQQAPRDLKVLLFAVPLAVGLAFHPSLPKVAVQAPQAASGETGGTFQNVVSTQVDGLKKAIADRAAIGLDENFRQGLDNWMGNNGSTAEWSFDQAGFVQPGRVALYQPSLGLKDYELQFLGAIDKSALSWVVRAADFENYYVIKLVVTKPGVIPQLGIIRYAVINGQPVDRVDTPVALNTRTDALYRVSMTLDGDRYSLSVQGQVIDAWKEDRLKHGGVGFFTNRGEQSRIGWVQITHQYDMLGRLFAYLAP